MNLKDKDLSRTLERSAEVKDPGKKDQDPQRP